MPKLKLGLETLNKDIDTESEIEISRDITEIGALIFITTVVMHFCVKQFALVRCLFSGVSKEKPAFMSGPNKSENRSWDGSDQI